MFNLYERFIWWYKQKTHRLVCFNRRCKLCEWYLSYDLHQIWMTLAGCENIGIPAHPSTSLYLFPLAEDKPPVGKLFFEQCLLEVLNSKKLHKSVLVDNIKGSIRDEIVVRMAIRIWEESGKMDGNDGRNWQWAENIVDNCLEDCMYVFHPNDKYAYSAEATSYLSVSIRYHDPRTDEVRRLDHSIPSIR